MTATPAPLRILAVSELWQGADSYGFVRAFRRQGHSLTIGSEQLFDGYGWRNPLLKAARRVLRPLIQDDFNSSLLGQADMLRPHLFFVCKGNMVAPETIQKIKASGAVAILWWPDISFLAHGPTVPRALAHYDWIFTTKTFGVSDLQDKFGIRAASYLPHGYDPETHSRYPYDQSDRDRYGCDVSFIGTWSPKKADLLMALAKRHPDMDLKIWGARWQNAGVALMRYCVFQEIWGAEFAKATQLSRINLGFLSAIQRGGPSGDRTTSRTFHIPAAGGFMLHERTDEVGDFFIEGRECAMFNGPEEMIAKIDHYLAHPEERVAIAAAGHQRCTTSGYSIDDRALTVVAKARDLLAQRLPVTKR